MSLPLVKRLPDPWRRIVDWAVTLALAIGFDLVPLRRLLGRSR